VQSWGFPSNSQFSGVGYVFGEDVVDRFLEVNNVDYILRAHQLCVDGYQVLFHDRFATVWSAPNYCYRARNKASILQIAEDHSKNFQLFKASEENEKRVEKNIGPAKLKAMDYFN
jgi:serine/threonine-protein phosphatase PPG1